MYLWIARCSSELRLFLVSRTLRTSLNFDGEYVRFNSTSKKNFFFILCVKYGLKLDYGWGYSHHQRFLVMGLDTAQQFYDPFTQQHIAWHWKLASWLWCGTILCFGNADKPQIWIKFLGNFQRMAITYKRRCGEVRKLLTSQSKYVWVEAVQKCDPSHSLILWWAHRFHYILKFRLDLNEEPKPSSSLISVNSAILTLEREKQFIMVFGVLSIFRVFLIPFVFLFPRVCHICCCPLF